MLLAHLESRSGRGHLWLPHSRGRRGAAAVRVALAVLAVLAVGDAATRLRGWVAASRGVAVSLGTLAALQSHRPAGAATGRPQVAVGCRRVGSVGSLDEAEAR